jgi:hypothetical protein
MHSSSGARVESSDQLPTDLVARLDRFFVVYSTVLVGRAVKEHQRGDRFLPRHSEAQLDIPITQAHEPF